jgi:hypothetical protein
LGSSSHHLVGKYRKTKKMMIRIKFALFFTITSIQATRNGAFHVDGCFTSMVHHRLVVDDTVTKRKHRGFKFIWTCIDSLSPDKYLENDLVAVRRLNDDKPVLCVVNTDGGVIPLCRRLDDVETDLFADPRQIISDGRYISITDKEVNDDDIYEGKVWGEGFYGQRPVPSLGGGPGYGAIADEVWSVSEELLESILAQGIDIPTIDVGIAHGEKARGGSIS